MIITPIKDEKGATPTRFVNDWKFGLAELHPAGANSHALSSFSSSGLVPRPYGKTVPVKKKIDTRKIKIYLEPVLLFIMVKPRLFKKKSTSISS
ncbi:MAG: hypothetical protein ACTSWN_04685 [Promethearchaeota archaeon]